MAAMVLPIPGVAASSSGAALRIADTEPNLSRSAFRRD